MNLVNWIVSIYGALLFVGGVIGFRMAHSLPSLVMASIFSIGIAISAVLIYKEKKAGPVLAAILSGMLSCFFTYRFWLTLKFFPAGLICLVSIFVFGFLIKTLKKQ